jgi:hypothetical protein
MGAWEALVARVGLRVARALALALGALVLFFGVKLAFAFMGWRLDRAQAQRDEARALVRQVLKEQAQVERALEITAATRETQDAAIHDIQGRTDAAEEIIHERVRSNPAGAAAGTDPVVLRELAAARARAQAAADRLSGSSPAKSDPAAAGKRR